MTEAESHGQDDETIAAGIRNEESTKMVGGTERGPDADEFAGVDGDGDFVGTGNQSDE